MGFWQAVFSSSPLPPACLPAYFPLHAPPMVIFAYKRLCAIKCLVRTWSRRVGCLVLRGHMALPLVGDQ